MFFLMKHLRTCHHSVWLSYCHRNLKTNHISCSMLCYRERMSLIFFKFDIIIVLFVMPTNNHANHFMVAQFGEQGWHIGENPILLPMWPGLEFWHHKPAKFVVQFLLCLKNFSLGFSVFILQQKSTLPDSNLILKQ